MNDLMSGGQHRLWKDAFVRRVQPRKGEAILDMAGGTGDIAFRLAARGAAVTVADINPEMLAVGIERAEKRGIDGLVWAEENAETLSFADQSFDAYTIAFGIRNVTDIPAALAEAHRVLQDRRALLLPRILADALAGLRRRSTRPIRASIVPRIGKAVAKDEDSYRYLIESIERFPDMAGLRAR